jgi:hypothetical protein
MTDLDALADEEASKATRGGPKCWTCSIPEREWVEKAYREGRTLGVIVSVLVRQGHESATVHKVKGHLANHVR